MQPQRKQQQRAIGAPRLVGRYDPPEPQVSVIDSAPEPPPPKKKIGRPTKHAVAMTDARRKQLQRKQAVIDEILHEILVDHRSGGAYGPGRYIKDADQGKGLLVTGGYDFAKLEAVDAQHNRPLRNPSRGKPSGAGPDIEAEMKFGEQFFTGRYTASFNHSWGHDAELSTRQGQHQGHALERQHVPGNYFLAREVLQVIFMPIGARILPAHWQGRLLVAHPA
jgi:hypothetical protein